MSRNRACCLLCGTIVESRTRHGFSMCPCPNQTFVDGGQDYSRAGAADWKYHLYIPDDFMPKRKKLNKAERAVLPLVVHARNVRYEPQIHEQATEAVTKKEVKQTPPMAYDYDFGAFV